jgi:hypothetical protein
MLLTYYKVKDHYLVYYSACQYLAAYSLRSLRPAGGLMGTIEVAAFLAGIAQGSTEPSPDL